jgi:hypothetical protein
MPNTTINSIPRAAMARSGLAAGCQNVRPRRIGAAESCTLWLRSKGVSAWLGEKYPPQL